MRSKTKHLKRALHIQAGIEYDLILNNNPHNFVRTIYCTAVHHYFLLKTLKYHRRDAEKKTV